MLADGSTSPGPWYTDAVTVLTLALVVLAILTIVVTVYLWRLGPPRKKIIYRMPPAISLLAPHSEFRALRNITVNFENERGDVFSVPNPYFASLNVENESRRDISVKDFDDNKSLVFDLGANIVSRLGGLPSDETMPLSDEELYIGERTIEVRPCLIRKGTGLSLNLLLSGPPRLTIKNPLINVDVQSETNDAFGWKQGAGCLVSIAIVAVVMVIGATWAASFGVNYYRTHTAQSYARYVHNVTHIEQIVIIILAIVAAVGVVVAVAWSRLRATNRKGTKRTQP